MDALPDMFYPSDLKERVSEVRNIAEFMLDRNVKRGLGGKVAAVSGSLRVSYGEMLDHVCRLANGLREIGVTKGDRILVKLQNCYESILTFLAILRLGAIIVPCHPLLSARETRYIAADAEVKAIITDADSAKELEGLGSPSTHGAEIITVDGPDKFLSIRELMRGKGSSDLVFLSPEDEAVILYTSGTTGKPKGCVHNHAEYLAVAYCYAERTIGCVEGDVVSGVPSLAFAYGHTGLFGNPLLLGETTVLIPRFDPKGILKAVEDERITILLLVPTAMRAILKSVQDPRKEYDLSSLRFTLSAGELCTSSLQKAWMEKVGCIHLQHLGSTEMFNGFISTTTAKNNPGSLGVPVYGYEIKVVREDWSECNVGEEGLLLVKGPTGTRYWRGESLQRSAVREGWNITGDVVYLDEEGYVWYVGRTDDIIKSSGYRVSPAEIEEAILEHPAVAEVAVIGVPDEEVGQIIKAYVVLKNGYEASTFDADIRVFLAERIARYKVPKVFEYVEELPKTITGKVKRKELSSRR